MLLIKKQKKLNFFSQQTKPWSAKRVRSSCFLNNLKILLNKNIHLFLFAIVFFSNFFSYECLLEAKTPSVYNNNNNNNNNIIFKSYEFDKVDDKKNNFDEYSDSYSEEFHDNNEFKIKKSFENIPDTDDVNNNDNMNELKRNDELTEEQTREALIQVFKMKLLELLDIDSIPSPSEIEKTSNPVPEAILKQYKQLEKLTSEANAKRAKNGRIALKHRLKNWHSRPSRENLDDSSHEIDELKQEADLDDEETSFIRFNSSIVDQITLVTNNIVTNDSDELVNQIDDDNLSYEKNSEQTDENNALNEKDWCNEKVFNGKNEQLNAVNCFKFNLEQKEFYLNLIRSAKLYLKLNGIDEAFFKIPANSVLQKTAYIYIEANGYLVKKIDLTKYFNKNINNNNNNIQNFLHFQMKEILENLISKNDQHENSETNRLTTLKIRFLLSKDFIKFAKSKTELKNYFAKMNENIALNIKFGDLTTAHNANNKNINQKNALRNKRHHANTSSYSTVKTTNNQESNKNKTTTTSTTNSSSINSSKQYKTTRDCADLRREGYTTSNFSCCRETLSFSMEQLGWSHYILFPKVIEYKYCRGGCLSK
jgi:hypothetical protein